jgi:hypothetical protein
LTNCSAGVRRRAGSLGALNSLRQPPMIRKIMGYGISRRNGDSVAHLLLVVHSAHELTATGAAPLRAVRQRLQRKDKAVPHDIVVACETNNAVLQVRC